MLGGMARALALSLLLLSTPRWASAQECEEPALVRAALEALVSDERDLTALARREGSDLPSVRGLRTHDGDDARIQLFLREFSADADAPVVCGQATSEGRRLVIAGARAARLQVDAATVQVTLAPGWSAPVMYLRGADGRSRHAALERGRGEIPPELRAPVDVQIVATGPQGPRPVVRRLVGLDRAAAAGSAPAVVNSDEPLPTRIQALRASAGVGPLRANRLLARVAARHAQQLCRERRVGHLGQGGDPVQRLAREGIVARHVGETAARSSDIGAAYAATLQSPAHRAALTDRRFTDVGVGIAAGRCLVVLLAAWPRAVPYSP